ncbi:helix-turn-helix domain-containing protein [Enterococcus florum]|uniref:helix-turn-helix domain-containing protein n=1 Tax=Enterococcus florum TaxID=2480627 RepID=UPI001D131FD8
MQVYIKCDHHLDSIAEPLHVYKNTVAYRIKKKSKNYFGATSMIQDNVNVL